MKIKDPVLNIEYSFWWFFCFHRWRGIKVMNNPKPNMKQICNLHLMGLQIPRFLYSYYGNMKEQWCYYFF